MSIFKFRTEQIRKLVDHTLSTKGGHSPAYRLSDEDPNQAEPGLLLVKDAGIYLMSNAKDRLPGENDETNFVAYAVGFEANVSGVWEKCRDAVGGDDFAELLPIGMFSPLVNDTDDATITVTVTANKVGVHATRKVPPCVDPARALDRYLNNHPGKRIVFGVRKGERKAKLFLFDESNLPKPEADSYALFLTKIAPQFKRLALLNTRSQDAIDAFMEARRTYAME